jgi:UDP-glucose 4-epimerase
MRVLITGSSGYLGSLLSNFLISKEIPVTGISFSRHPDIAEGKYFKNYCCDVADRDRLSSIFKEEEPTHVIHLASTFNKVRNREREYSVDIGGSKNILEISDATYSVRQLIYSSSAVAYGGHKTNPEWIPESFPLLPGKYRYGLNKSIVEEMFASIPVRKDLHVLILRICQVTGPSRSSESALLKLLLKSPVLPRVCMNNKMQLLHESDFLSLMTRILHDEEIEGVYNMAPDNYAGIVDLAPNKLYLPLPVSIISAVLWILWHTRLMNLESVSVNNGIFPIIIDPTKLMRRFDYKFRYTTADAFSDTMMNDKRFSEALHQMKREMTISNFLKKHTSHNHN